MQEKCFGTFDYLGLFLPISIVTAFLAIGSHNPRSTDFSIPTGGAVEVDRQCERRCSDSDQRILLANENVAGARGHSGDGVKGDANQIWPANRAAVQGAVGWSRRDGSRPYRRIGRMIAGAARAA